MSLHYLYTILLHYTACSRRNERLESKKAAGVNPRPTIKGYGLCPKPLYYKGETSDKTV